VSNISVDYDVLNQRGSPAWFTDTFANIPTAGFKGRMFISTDTFAFYRDTGTGWDLIGGPGTGTLTGSGVSGQVSFFNGTQTITGNNNLFWNNTNSRLGINTATPGAPLDIHGTGTLIQVNGTGVGNGLIAYQQAGASKWTAGNFFDGTLNTFAIYNVGLVTNALTISSTTNDITLTGNLNNGVKVITTGGIVCDTAILLKNLGSVTGTNGYSSFSGNAANNGFTFAPNNSSYHRFITPTTGNYNYTLPATTGTIAILEAGTQTFTGTLNVLGSLGTKYGISIEKGNTPSPLSFSDIFIYASSGATNIINFANSSYITSFSFPTSNQTFTFPATTGTIALTSNLSGYLPLTGGTLTGVLNGTGINLSSVFYMENNQSIYMKNNSTTYYSVLYINTNNKVAIDGSGLGTIFGGTIGNGTYTYTLPSASGTLALTSDLSSYLPLTGGTLTGQLYINPTNTATTGLDVASDTISFRSDNLEGNKRQLLITMGSGTLIQFTAQGYGANYGTDLAFYTATTSGVNSSPAIYITGTNNRVGIKNGTPSYDLDVSGNIRSTTSAYFASSSGTASIGIIPQTDKLFIYNASGTNTGLSVQQDGTGDIFRANGNSGANRFVIQQAGNVGIGQNGASSVVRLVVTGVDSTSSNYALIVTNSAGQSLLESRNDGYTSLGTRTNSPYNYNVTFSPRTAGLDASGGIGYIVSTKESKGNIKTLNNIDYINQLNPVSFNYRKKNNDNTEFIDDVFNDVYYGFIADELEKINKDLVFYDILEDGTKKLAGVHYNSVIAILTKAIQDLNEKLKRNNIN
jgi:hypothetical protein